jgi:SPP1 gp7 family putative phage head morphogenesis protein
MIRIFREADAGYPAHQVELFGEIEEADAHISSQIQMRLQAIIALDYEVYTDSDDAKAVKAAEFCRKILFDLEDLDDLLLTLMDAVPQGWAWSELGWDISEGQAVIQGHRRIPQTRTLWDDNGIPRLATDEEPIRGIELAPAKIVYHRRRSRSSIDSNAGVMRTVAWWWLFKAFSIKDWVSYSEIFGMPFRLGKYESGASDDDKKALLRAVANLGTDGAAVISKSTEIEFIEATKGGQLVYERLSRYCDSSISKAILGQTLTSDVGQVGSYAAAKIHDNVRNDLRDADAWSLAKTIRRELLAPLTLFNFGPDCPVPWFKFNLEEPEDLASLSTTYTDLHSLGLPIPTAHIYERFGVPAPEPGDEVLKAGHVETTNKAFYKTTQQILNSSKTADSQAAIDRLIDAALVKAQGPAEAMAKPILAAINNAQDWDQALGNLLQAYRDMGSDDLAAVLERAVIAAEVNGRLSADPQVAQKIKNKAKSYQRELNSLESLILEPVDPEEAIDFWERQAPVDRATFDALADEAKTRAFTVAEVAKDDMLTGMFQAVDAAIKAGTTFAEFKHAADLLGLSLKPHHLETVFHNNVQSAYMAGRYRQMVDPDVLDARPYWQYDAVGDKQTRPSHAAMDGKIYHSGHPIWSSWYPPNGHRCRCDVVSLSAEEMRRQGLSESTKPVPGVEPDEGWSHSVGESGWGRGLVEAQFSGMAKRGGWSYRPDLCPNPDKPPLKIKGSPQPSLPKAKNRLLESMNEDEVREHYRRESIQRIGMQIGPDDKVQDLPLKNGVVMAGRMLEHAGNKPSDLARGRFLGLAREVVESPDETWLVPGSSHDGRVSLRKRYLKFYKADAKNTEKAVLCMAEAERGVWTVFNVYPVGRDWTRNRKGLLL